MPSKEKRSSGKRRADDTAASVHGGTGSKVSIVIEEKRLGRRYRVRSTEEARGILLSVMDERSSCWARPRLLYRGRPGGPEEPPIDRKRFKRITKHMSNRAMARSRNAGAYNVKRVMEEETSGPQRPWSRRWFRRVDAKARPLEPAKA